MGSGLDNYQWTTLLRAMSAHRAFHWAYGGDVTARKIAHFLILNPQCPRSLIACTQGMNMHLDRLARGYGRNTAAQKRARRLAVGTGGRHGGSVFDEGMHEFLSRFIGEVATVAALVHEDYLSGDVR